MKKNRQKLMEIYERLLDQFGPRHWWPADTPFEVVVGAILTQSVSWSNVVKAINNLKSAELLDAYAIIHAPIEVIEEAVRPTRYYRQKAERLRTFCSTLMEESGGDLDKFFQPELADLRTKLLSMKGIGKETADSIILYAAEKPIFVVDAYTRRIFSRLGFFTEDVSYDEMQHFFMRHLEPVVPLYNEYHALIDRLGNQLCSNNKPKCTECPLQGMCRGLFTHSAEYHK